MKLHRWRYKNKKSKHSHLHVRPGVVLVLLLTLFEAAVIYWNARNAAPVSFPDDGAIPHAAPRPGDLIRQDSVEHFTPAQSATLIRHNYPAGVPDENTAVTKVIFHYRSELPDGKQITVYGRAYLPDTAAANLPVFAFAPGTTGIGDQCAASLEKPAAANWANYDSHLTAYAAQGYAVVTTDYEGMRDPDRPHHYMVGELEGRAVLDSVRALRHLPQARGRLSSSSLFLGGYSQGGHAAFWADKIAARYAPDVRPLGVVGFGPVMSVKETLTDVVRGANINWFGPNVLASYADYYHEQYLGVLLPRRDTNLLAEVSAHCIDTDLPYWGHTPVGLYTPEFIAAAQTGDLAAPFPQLSQALDENAVGEVGTPSAKRINQGERDNVVLPSQQTAAVPRLCASSLGPVEFAPYPTSTHYDTMLHSFSDTLAWMKTLSKGETVPSTCH
jgi:hypothetical protein